MSRSFFKDILEQEIHTVFLNPDLFAEEISLAGRKMFALVSSLETAWPDSDADATPVSYERMELQVSLEDFPDRLWQGKPLSFNGKTWHVEASDTEDVRCIRLYREIR